MGNIRVRIHEAEDWERRPTTVIGLRGLESGSRPLKGLMTWLAAMGRIARPFPEGIAVRGGDSDVYIQAHPPLEESEIKLLAAACLEGMFTVPGNGSVQVYDNREVSVGRDGPENILATTSLLGQQALAA